MSVFEVTDRIPEFFGKQSVFITGATGFLGKVLIEKLLRSCPDISTMYLLMRPKKGKTLEERINMMTEIPLFERLKEERPNALRKLIPVNGDICQLNLGLSESDRNLLIESVSLVFHVAATVRFDSSLKEAILMNARGTRELCDLVLEMKTTPVLVHISTTYCNIDQKVIKEKLYPPHADWQDSIKIAESFDDYALQILSQKYNPFPNTYIFSKSLAEHVVFDKCNGKIPTVIFRPSVVISTMEEPMPGWIDNFNGPVGLLVACGKGITRTVYMKRDIVCDYMPVDVAVKCIITAAWKKGCTENEKQGVAFYNCSSYKINFVTMQDIINMGRQLQKELPLNDALWHPDGDIATNKIIFYFLFVLLHLIPAVFVDLLLKLSGRKPMLLKLQKRIYIATMALEHFTTNEWAFVNDKLLNLREELQPEDRADFFFETDNVDIYGYFRNALYGGRNYLMKELDETLPAARVRAKRLLIIHKVTTILFYSFLVWLSIKLGLISYVSETITAFLNKSFQ